MTRLPPPYGRRRGPDVVAHPVLRGRRYRLRGPAAVDVARALGVQLLVNPAQMTDIEAYCQAAHLLLVVARDRSQRTT